MLNFLDEKAEAILAEQIRRYIDQEHLELEHRGESGTAPKLNSCVLLVGLGNQGANTVSQILRQLYRIGISSDDYLGLALVDAYSPERDKQVEYIVMEDCLIPRNRVPEKLLEKKDEILGTLETLNTRLTNVIARTSATIKIYVVSDLSEDLFASCSILMCLLEDKLNQFYVANTGIEVTGLFFQSAMLRTQREQAKVFASWQEIKDMSSPDYKLEIALGDLPEQRANRVFRETPIFAITYLYSDFNENFSPILKTVDDDFSVAEMLAMLIYLKSRSQFNEARVFNSLQMPSAAVSNGLPRFATIGYSKKSLKISPIFSETCWYHLNNLNTVHKSKAGYISQDWEAVLEELEINHSGMETLETDIYSSVEETLKELKELPFQLEHKVFKELLVESLATAERLLMGEHVKRRFEDRVIKGAQQITADYLPKQLERFARILKGYLQNERRGLFYVKRLLKSEDETHKQSLTQYLESNIKAFMIQSDALRLRADRACQQALSRLEIEPDKKGLLGFRSKQTNFLRRLVEVKYELLQKAVVYDQLREILKAYLGYTHQLYALIQKQEENILSLEKALQTKCHTERLKLVAAGEDGLIDLVKDQVKETQPDEINKVLAAIFREHDLTVFQGNSDFLELIARALFANTKQLLRQANLETLFLEELLERLTQTQPAKGQQLIEDLYAKCNLALSLSQGMMSRLPETHYYFFYNEGNSSLRSYIKGLFQGKPHDVLFVDDKSSKSIRMVKACFGFDLQDIYFYRNYEEAYEVESSLF